MDGRARKRRWPMGRLSSPQATVTQIKHVFRRHPCDRCGFSHDGSTVSVAKYKIVTPKGPLYLCRHHYMEHSHCFLVSDYPVSLEEVDIAS